MNGDSGNGLDRSGSDRPGSPGDITYTLMLILATRFILTVIGVLARVLIQPLYKNPYPWNFTKSAWLAIWGVWDTGWYLDIAISGYSSHIYHHPAVFNQANYAFFPLYPMTMRVLSPIYGGAYNAGLVISNISLFLACLVLIRLVSLDHDAPTARRAAKYAILLPTAFIFSGVFTESLFLFLIVSAFYLVRTERLPAAGIVGFLASLTRSVGVVLILPLVIQYWLQRRARAGRPDFRMAYLLIAPLGLVSFSVFNYILSGDAFAFAQIQSSWGRTLQCPLSVLFRGFSDPSLEFRFSAWMTIIAIIILTAFFRKLNGSYLILSFLFLVIPLSSSLQSMPRYLLAVFPMPILLAVLTRNRAIDEILTILLALIQGALMVLWTNGFKLIL